MIDEQGPVERVLKFILPVRDDPALLPVIFQNTKLFDLHGAFLTRAFPERFPTLTTAEYDRLVGRRASRDYFVGSALGLLGPVAVWVFLSDIVMQTLGG